MEDLDTSKIICKPLTGKEKMNIVTALNQGTHFKGVWLKCVNNHPVLVGNCGKLYDRTIYCEVCNSMIISSFRANEFNNLRSYKDN